MCNSPQFIINHQALKLPVSEQNREHPRNVPLLPPNKFTLQAFENLMNNREDLVNSAKLFQFPKNLSPPQPWSRTQVEKFVETSRILGKSFLTNQTINGNLVGELFFDKKLVNEKNKKIIERMRRSLLGANSVASDEVIIHIFMLLIAQQLSLRIALRFKCDCRHICMIFFRN